MVDIIFNQKYYNKLIKTSNKDLNILLNSIMEKNKKAYNEIEALQLLRYRKLKNDILKIYKDHITELVAFKHIVNLTEANNLMEISEISTSPPIIPYITRATETSSSSAK
jgi:hypothetical protein